MTIRKFESRQVAISFWFRWCALFGSPPPVSTVDKDQQLLSLHEF
jgi:hypothetical protein